MRIRLFQRKDPLSNARKLLTNEEKGMLLGLLGVVAFSLTLPATRAAVAVMSPIFVSMGRAVLASLPAAAFLWLGSHRRPNKAELKSLMLVASGVVLGFPILSAWALKYVDASHGGLCWVSYHWRLQLRVVFSCVNVLPLDFGSLPRSEPPL